MSVVDTVIFMPVKAVCFVRASGVDRVLADLSVEGLTLANGQGVDRLGLLVHNF